MPKSSFRALPLVASLMLLSACMSEQSQPLPADFVPGGIYGITADECRAKGGTMTKDGLGLDICLT